MVQPRVPAGSGAGGTPTRSTSAHDDDYDSRDRPPERVIPIRGGRRREQVRRATQAESDGEAGSSAPRRGPAPSRRDGGNNAIQQAALTIGAFVVAVVVLGYVLSQVLATGGERVAPAPTPAATRTDLAAADLPGENPGAEDAGAAVAEQSAPDEEPSAADEPKPIEFESRVLEPNYTVEPGDTLGTIAEQSGNTIDALVGLNNLPDRDGLSVGQSLIVPES